MAAISCGALGGQPLEPARLWPFVVLAGLLELGSRRLGGLGVFSGASAVYLAVGWSPELGGRAALFLTAIGLTLRTLKNANADLERRLNEALAEACSTLGSVAVVAGLQLWITQPNQVVLWAGGLSAYLALSDLVSRWLAPEVAEEAEHFLNRRRASFATLTGPAFGAPALLALGDWRMLFLLPLLVAPGWLKVEEPAPETEQANLETRSLSDSLAKTQEALQTKVEERLLLEQLIRDFAKASSLEEVLELAVETVSRLLPCQSAVIFLRRSDSVRPAAWRSPHRDRLENSELLDVQEPIVEECLRTRRIILSQPHHVHGQRLLVDEASAVALPLADFGALYVGRSGDRRYDRKQLLLLALATDQTIPAILAGRRQSQLRAALEAQAQANHDLDRAHRDLSQAHQSLKESQAQLVHSSKLAAVGQLAAGVAHEINSPLAAVMIRLQSAQRSLRKGKPDKVPPKLEDAIEATRSAKAIIETLLEYSRPGADGQEPRELIDLVENALSIVGAAEGIGLVKELNTPGKVHVNSQEIQQIITNLVLNAQHALTASGTQEAKIQVRSRATPTHLVIEVEDNGPGIPPQVAERIFEPFFTTKPVGHGTGLGLSVSLKLAEKNGGTLTYQPGPSGAKFELTLPRTTGPEGATP